MIGGVGPKESMWWTQGIPGAYLRRDSREVQVKTKAEAMGGVPCQRSVNQAFLQSLARFGRKDGQDVLEAEILGYRPITPLGCCDVRESIIFKWPMGLSVRGVSRKNCCSSSLGFGSTLATPTPLGPLSATFFDHENRFPTT